MGTFCILAGLMLIKDGGETSRRGREIPTGHGITDNMWYRNANLTAVLTNMTNCYVCSFVPHHANSNPFWTPEPETEVNTMCMVANWTLQLTGSGHMVSRYLPNCAGSQEISEWRDPKDYTTSTNISNVKGIAPARYPTKPLFCFSRACQTDSGKKEPTIFLGTLDCK